MKNPYKITNAGAQIVRGKPAAPKKTGKVKVGGDLRSEKK